ncbi:MAG TPA: class I SAM-dependent methyltransferase [Planctomycetes bacterium]|nr:class I SAM-dependent methyltransferase [Planctomycetota bacterium]
MRDTGGERARRLFDERAASGSWAGLYRGPSTLRSHPFQARFTAVERMLAQIGSVECALDVGAGSCDFAPLVQDLGGWYAALDTSIEMLRLGRDSKPGMFVQGEAEALPFSSGRFDLVLALGLFGFLPELGPACREIARVLRPGGVLIAQGGKRDLWSRLGRPRRMDPTAVEQPVPPRRLDRALAAVGFAPVLRRYVDFIALPRRFRERLPRTMIRASHAMGRMGPLFSPLARSHVTMYRIPAV